MTNLFGAAPAAPAPPAPPAAHAEALAARKSGATGRAEGDMKYRPDIDGLRAVSVLAVVAFHLGIVDAPGGFIGVDVFFVISGYLICSLIRGDLEAKRFTLAHFYERRIRRIFPALFVVLAGTTLASAALLYPPSFTEFAQSLLAATLSVSNFYFAATSGYFADQSSIRPLLHTWSLAVEEQFYVVFPLTLATLYKMPRNVMLSALGCLAVLSFAASAFGAYTDPTATFYLPHTRAWELLLGVLLALGAFPAPKQDWIKHSLGLIGLALILGSVLALNSATPFPGPAALPACAGAALVIASGVDGKSIVARMLSMRPIVLVGLISYSLYLWHWPIIVLFREWTNTVKLTRIEEAALAATSTGLALLTWWFVERPPRRAAASKRVIFTSGFIAVSAAASLAAVILVSAGMPSRFNKDVDEAAAFAGYDPKPDFRWGVCFIASGRQFGDFDRGKCLHAASGKRNVLLLGDSHAAHLWRALSQTLTDTNVMQANVSGCPPTIEIDADAPARCTELLNFVFHDYLAHHRVDAVILSCACKFADLPRLARTLDWLTAHSTKVVLIGPSPEYDAPLPLLLAKAIQTSDHGLPERHRAGWTASLDQTIARVAAERGIAFGSLYRFACPRDRCAGTVGANTPLLFDRDHFTPEASRLAVAALQREGVFGS